MSESGSEFTRSLVDAGKAERAPAGTTSRVHRRLAQTDATQSPSSASLRLISSAVTTRESGHRARPWRLVAGAAAVSLMAIAYVAFTRDSSPGHGEVRANAHEEVHLGTHVIAVLEKGAQIAWDGDDVTQSAGDVFYRVEPGGVRRVHTPAGDVTVRGTCFDVKVQTEEGADMTRRDVFAGAVGALAGAAVLVGVYEGKVTLSRANASVDIASGQGARADAQGIHGPQGMDAASKAFESPSPDEPWRTANAGLAEQVKEYQQRFADNQAQTKATETELRRLKARLASLEPDAAALRDPFSPTLADWQELAKEGVVRAKNFCFPSTDWQPSAGDLSSLGLAPGDGSALRQAVAAASERMWQAVEPACAKLVGSSEVAAQLGSEVCGMALQKSATQAQVSADAQLVANIRAGVIPMPPPGEIDGLAARMLAMTGAAPDLEKELSQSFGPDVAHAIASGDVPWGSCEWQFGAKLPRVR
jgi:hypothetical protein